jgi:hypothetical protein
MTASHFVLPALADLLAALLFGGGLLFIARLLARKNNLVGELAYAGFFFTAGNAVLIALTKLLMANRGVSAAQVKSGSGALLTVGFICLAWALWRGLRTKTAELTAGRVWLTPLFINALVLGTAMVLRMLRWGRAWYWLLIGVAIVGGILTFLQLAWRAQERRLSLLALIFALSFAVALAQSGLLSSAEQMPHGLEPLCKVIAQSAFAAAAWQFSKAERLAQNIQK